MIKTVRITTLDLLNERLNLTRLVLPPKYQDFRPLRSLKLIRFKVDNYSSPQLASITCMNTEIVGIVNMFSLLIRPDYHYHLPILSTELISVGKRRTMLFEIVNTISSPDENIKRYYARLNEIKNNTPYVVEIESNNWYYQLLAECSFKLSGTSEIDELLLSMFLKCIGLYLEMAANPKATDVGGFQLMRQSTEGFVNKLLTNGGPAVNVFKILLGEVSQKEFVRTVMFGLE